MIRLAFAAVGIGILAYLFKAGSQVANSFGYTIKGYGTPQVNLPNVTIPVMIEFKNPTSLPINIDNITAKIYVMKSGQWVNAANLNQSLSIPGGTSQQKINASIDLGQIFGGNIFSTFALIGTSIQSKTIQVRTDFSGKYGALTLPLQSITQNVQIG